MAHVLVIEDDPGIRSAVLRALRTRGHAVEATATGMDGLQKLLAEEPDVLILDLGLPDIPGEQLLGMIRAVSQVPIIVATARDDGDVVVELLDAGADDYLIKPYEPAQLEARLRAVLRRASKTQQERADTLVRVGGLRVDLARRTADIDDRPLDLTRLEFEMLAYLAEHSGRVVSRRELLREVWQRTDSVRTVDVHLSWLRRKLGENLDQPRFIHIRRGVGVLLEDRDSPGPTRDDPVGQDSTGPDGADPGAG